MSLKTYYSRILARGKPGFPTLEEARQRFQGHAGRPYAYPLRLA